MKNYFSFFFIRGYHKYTARKKDLIHIYANIIKLCFIHKHHSFIKKNCKLITINPFLFWKYILLLIKNLLLRRFCFSCKFSILRVTDIFLNIIVGVAQEVIKSHSKLVISYLIIWYHQWLLSLPKHPFYSQKRINVFLPS